MSAKADCSKSRIREHARAALSVRGGTPDGRTQLAGRVLALLPEDFRVLVIEGRVRDGELESVDGRGFIRHLRYSDEGWLLQHHGPPLFRQQQIHDEDTDLCLRIQSDDEGNKDDGFAVLADETGEVLAREDQEDPVLRQGLAEWLARDARKPPLAGLVLAGGHSRRMGREKAGLVYRDRPQREAAYELLKGLCDKVWLSQREEQEDKGLPVIHDRFLDFGPAGGILSAMHELPDHAWLVVACDLPYLGPETLEQLVRERIPLKGATAYRSAHGGLPEPLCAIWEPAMRPVIHRFVAAGISCPRKILIKSSVRMLDLPRAEALDNVNHPEEFEEARRRLGEEG